MDLRTKENCTWRGRKLADLSREELEDAFFHIMIEYDRMLSPVNIRASALGKVEMIKRNEC